MLASSFQLRRHGCFGPNPDALRCFSMFQVVCSSDLLDGFRLFIFVCTFIAKMNCKAPSPQNRVAKHFHRETEGTDHGVNRTNQGSAILSAATMMRSSTLHA